MDHLHPDPPIQAFWQEFLCAHPGTGTEERFLEHFSFGTNAASADELARLVVAGTKTATSTALWEYEGTDRRVPRPGDLSIVTDGEARPVCVIETTEITIIPFRDVDADFARDYGEGDGTLAWWKRAMWATYGHILAGLGKQPSAEMPLVCERFRVVYAPTMAPPSSPP